MDNALDGRLRRVEAALAAQGEALGRQSAQLEQTHTLLVELLSLMTRDEPDGPPLHELLEALINRIEHGHVVGRETLAAIERLSAKIGSPG